MSKVSRRVDLARVGESRRVIWCRVKNTSVVFDAHMQLCVDQVRGDVHRLLGVDEDILVVFGVVGCACGDVQHILLRVRYFGHCTS
jgi:hypothetical protein